MAGSKGVSGYVSGGAYNTASRPAEQPKQSLPVTTTTDRPNLLSHEALEAPNIAPLLLVQDPAQNLPSSSSASQACTQVTPLAEPEPPHSQHTFTVVIPQPLDPDSFENRGRDPDNKQSDGIGINTPASSQSKQRRPVPSAVDDPRLKLSPETANLLAHEQALPSEHKSTTASSGTVGSLSLGAATTEVAENLGTDHHGDDLAHLTTLLHQLNIQPGTLHYRIILDTCDRVREHAPQGEQSLETQGSPSISTSTSSRSSENGTRSSTNPSKRLHQQCEDDDSSEEELKRCKTSQTISDFECSRALSCLFYKVNPHIYFDCANFKAKTISALGEHLRKRHVGEKGHKHCEKCCVVFKTERELAQHRCRETRGPCVCRILPLKRTQGVDPAKRWEETWDALFPKLRKPVNPWWSKDIFCQQILLSHQKRQWETGCNNSANLISEVLSEWVTTPPEHLPDLQDFGSRVANFLANNTRNHPDRLTETSFQVAWNPGTAEDAGSPRKADEGDLGITQKDREPSPSSTLDYNVRPDKDTSNTISYVGSSGITVSPSQDVNINAVLDPGLPWEFETEESQIPWSHPITHHPADGPLSGSDPHFDARVMDIWNSGSGFGEISMQSINDSWTGFELEPDFFTNLSEDYEYQTGL